MPGSYAELTTLKDPQIVVWLDLSTFCNASCPQCHRTDTNGLGKVDWLPLIKWSLEDFTKKFPAGTIDQVLRFEICGTWGDPIMSKDLAKICKHIIDHSQAQISINTNGGTRTPKWWEDLGNYCGNRLTVHFDIDGINNEMHQKYRRGVDLQTVLDNMEALSSTEAITGAFIILFKHNQDHAQQIKELAMMYGASFCYIIKSDRFLANNKFKFTNEHGKEEWLEEMDINLDHMIQNPWVNQVSKNMMKAAGKTDKSEYTEKKSVRDR